MRNFFSPIPKRTYKLAKSWHKYIGLALSLFLIWMSISGVILNHPDWFANFSVSKNLVPDEYHPYNWNRGAVVDAEFIGEDTLFFAGKQGIWRSIDRGKSFISEKENGFTDSRYFQKTNDICLLKENKQIVAATYGGIWLLDLENNHWQQADLGNYTNDQFVKIINRGNELLAFSKSGVYKSSIQSPLLFEEVELRRNSRPYMDLIMFFFALHSGWLWGLPGKLVYDIAAIVLIFLSATALYITFKKKINRKNKQNGKVSSNNKWLAFTIKNHSKIGLWILGFLMIFGGTGLFMRPPLLVALVNGKVPDKYIPSYIVKNPWYHSIRNTCYDPVKDRIILDTTEGLFEGKADLSEEFKPINWDVNIFVMGATVFEAKPNEHFWIGSFYGLFDYKEGKKLSKDLMMNTAVPLYQSMGRPAQYMVTGYFQRPDGEEFVSAHGQGLMNLDMYGKQPYQMPKEMYEDYRMSLWNYMFELHNGRLFSPILGKWGILFIPITALLFLILNITGTYEYIYRNRKKLFRLKKK
ncbi:PepSY-associated TM helix domain-containing protein [Sediminitomix flava]|uniref:PepSY-associated transmembrane protein n=1 Tax=Sediminitomix flava TaxID=379075 RepID=A0A315ZV08_SEDFL|nr:PepSY-associated TM helix domain-containing protein [Sediminitomix flava]PWJ40009.1 PepSY-associated transmembrane protein [Sediminitomix flava]